tara:strand:+ start:732 stop:926 length:195 start_codon:yes stop_codon:yes gene_type:complete
MIRIGDYVEALIHVLTLGYGKRLSTYIAVDLMGFESCGCCERREWLNRLTDKEYNGNCKDIKLW